MRAAPPKRQRGFLLNPWRFGGSCARDGFLWVTSALTDPDTGLSSSHLRHGDGVFLSLRSTNGANYVWRSTDSARNFARVSLGAARDTRNLLSLGGGVWLLVLGNTFASTLALRSSDGGVTWSEVTIGASGYYYGSDFGAGVVRLARYNNVTTRVSTDLGATWADGPSLPAAVQVRSMRYFGGYWYLNITGSSTVYRLNESTGIWSEYTVLAGTTVNGFYTANGKLFFVTAAGLYVSSDGGATAALAASTAAWGGHLVGQIWWNAADGFYFCVTRADNAAPNVMRASYDGEAWHVMGSSPGLPPGTYNGVASAWDGATMVVGGPKAASNALYYGECA